MVHPVIAERASKKTPEALAKVALHKFIDGRKGILRDAAEPLLNKIYAELFIKKINEWDKARCNPYQVDLKSNPKLDAEDLEQWFACSSEQAKIAFKMLVNYKLGLQDEVEPNVVTLKSDAIELITETEADKTAEKKHTSYTVIIGHNFTDHKTRAMPQQQAGFLAK